MEGRDGPGDLTPGPSSQEGAHVGRIATITYWAGGCAAVYLLTLLFERLGWYG